MREHAVYFSTSENLSKIASGTIKLMITSPPYWDLKDYEMDNQIGYGEDYLTYLARLNQVWLEIYRVLSANGVAIININTKSSNKRLRLIPYDFIKQLKKIGFKFRDVHYWHKSSGMPLLNNFGDHFEYFLIFSKGDKFTFNEFDYFDYKAEHRSKHINIWNINKRAGSIGKKFMVHPAIFPLEYIVRLVKIFTNVGDTVIDPFLGSGTTLIACMQTNRVCVGYELNKVGYLPLITKRLADYGLDLKQVKIA